MNIDKTEGLKVDNPSLDYGLKNPDIQLKGDTLISLYEDKNSGKYKIIVIGKSILIDSISKNIETEEIKYDLNINTFDDRLISVNGMDRLSTRDGTDILKLSALGADVNSRNAKYYIGSFENQERFIKLKNFHEKLGWGKYNGKDIFKHSKAIGVESKYKGKLEINKSGSLEKWLEFQQNEIIGHIPLEVAIAIGLSAVVVGFIGEEISVNSQMIHIYGNSSTGKTTAGELIISTATKPTLANNGLMYSWNSTANALIGNIRRNQGLPILFDDSSVSRIRDFSSILYQIVQGRDKDRMNKEGEMRESDTWRTTIISTGEQSLMDNANKNDGIRVRLIEFPDINWTKDAEHSERIKREVQENYGHGVEIVAESLIRLGKKETLEKIEEVKRNGKVYLESKGRENVLYDRLLNSVATIVLGISLLEEELNLGFNIKEISQFILDYILIDDRAIEYKAYDACLSYVESNINRFNREVYKLKSTMISTVGSKSNIEEKYKKYEIKANTNQKILGKIEDISIKDISKEEPKIKEGNKRLLVERETMIIKEEFKNIMKELGFNNPTGILKEWKRLEILNCEKDRHTRSRRITEDGSSIEVYVIRSKIKTETKESLRKKATLDFGELIDIKNIEFEEL